MSGPAAGPAARIADLVLADAEGPTAPAGVLRDRRLWATLAGAAVLAAGWQVAVTVTHRVAAPGSLDVVPLALFLVPVLYLSVNLGLAGGLAVSGLASVVTALWAVESVVQGDRDGAWFDVVELAVICVVAFFVGRGVDAEREARRSAEASRQAHAAAELRYRELFAANSEPLLLVDGRGEVREANAAAGSLFASWRPLSLGMALGDLIGADPAAALLRGEAVGEAVDLSPPGSGGPGEGALYLPVISPPMGFEGGPLRQVVLRDMTREARRRQQVQAYAGHVLEGQEEERRRIAQELHDGPLQNLIHLCRQVDLVAESALPDPADDGPDQVALGDIRALAESVVDEIRGISRGLRPPVLDDLGLVAALERLCDEVGRRGDLRVDLAVAGAAPELAPEVELAVYRIVQESLSNVVRHAQAHAVDVSVAFDGAVTCTVSDDGRGLPARVGTGVADLGTSGLVGMHERAALVGGSLDVGPGAGGRGTTIRIEVPLQREG